MDFLGHIYRAVRAHPLLGRTAIRAIPDVRWKVDVKGIGAMVVSLRRNRSYWLRDPLYHEGFMLGAVQRLINRGDTVFDAGANVGLYTRFMIQRFGAGHVVAFEPMRDNHAWLRRNVELGQCEDRVQIIEAALADYDGTDEFQTDDMSSASGTLNVIAQHRACQGRQQYGFPPLTETVKVMRLDSLVESGHVPVPHVIKVDVEGAEERVLRGAVRTLERHGPKLAIELHGVDTARSVVKFLLQSGYYIFGFLNIDRVRVYKEIVAADINHIRGIYSLHHCIAGRERGVLQTPPSLQI